MARITIVGNANIETTVRVAAFPIEYAPTRFVPFGVASAVSAVGYNLTRALTRLGDTVSFAAILGNDANGQRIAEQVRQLTGDTTYLVFAAQETAQSTVLYDDAGRRMVFTDLKNILECTYPTERFQQAIAESDLVVLTNIAYSKPLLALAQQQHKPIATDVHTIVGPFDTYNQPFLRHATIVFLSGEALELPVEACAAALFAHYPAEIIVIGLGATGAYLAVRHLDLRMHLPAVITRPIVQTGGAGDALFAAFLHMYRLTGNPVRSLRAAMVFASYKIGAATSSEGFLTHAELETLIGQLAEG